MRPRPITPKQAEERFMHRSLWLPLILCLISSTVLADDDLLMPRVYTTIHFGGGSRSVEAKAGFRIDYAHRPTGATMGTRLFRSSSLTQPALFQWEVSGEAGTVALGGVQVAAYEAVRRESRDSGRSERVTRRIVTATTITLVAVGAVVALVDAYSEELGESLAEAFVPGVDDEDDGGDSGGGSTGDDGSICIGDQCVLGGG
jgi:hypothetical protein